MFRSIALITALSFATGAAALSRTRNGRKIGHRKRGTAGGASGGGVGGTLRRVLGGGGSGGGGRASSNRRPAATGGSSGATPPQVPTTPRPRPLPPRPALAESPAERLSVASLGSDFDAGTYDNINDDDCGGRGGAVAATSLTTASTAADGFDVDDAGGGGEGRGGGGGYNNAEAVSIGSGATSSVGYDNADAALDDDSDAYAEVEPEGHPAAVASPPAATSSAVEGLIYYGGSAGRADSGGGDDDSSRGDGGGYGGDNDDDDDGLPAKSDSDVRALYSIPKRGPDAKNVVDAAASAVAASNAAAASAAAATVGKLPAEESLYDNADGSGVQPSESEKQDTKSEPRSRRPPQPLPRTPSTTALEAAGSVEVTQATIRDGGEGSVAWGAGEDGEDGQRECGQGAGAGSDGVGDCKRTEPTPSGNKAPILAPKPTPPARPPVKPRSKARVLQLGDDGDTNEGGGTADDSVL